MQKAAETLVAFASWEDRFGLGLVRSLERCSVGCVLVFCFEEYEVRTSEQRNRIRKYCGNCGVGYSEICVSTTNPARSWRTIHDAFSKWFSQNDRILVDISTMPREIIWYVLWMSEIVALQVRYVYHSPERYSDGWLSRDPRAPRLVYKLSGVSMPSLKTALLVTAGFDYERIKRLVDWYEPAKLVIGVQVPSLRRKRDVVEEEFKNYFKAECEFYTFEMNAFADDRGTAAIDLEMARIGKPYNILMSSLGPKISAISLYRIQRSRPEIGLVYAPSKEFNEEYSSGIGESYWGTL